ncbi:MAG TPA: DUF1501 domain-containing protein [Chitinophagaceae bacterium]|nr:DUF1501 domain-containing protein [Chitinophagaceae bacterium]
MKRRKFLQTAPAFSLPFLIKGFPVQAMTKSPLLQLLGQQSLLNGRVLVLIQLNGGNDGINTVIPVDQYAMLSVARPNILIPENKVLSLNNVNGMGLHPGMTEMRNMYNNGQLHIVRDVSYPNPSFSHFRATDIWLTGADAQNNQYLTTGWLGRAIDEQYPGYPDTLPTTHPLAVQLGSQASSMLQTSETNAAFTVIDPASFYDFVDGVVPAMPDTPYGNELTFIRKLQHQTDQYATLVSGIYKKGVNKANYATASSLGKQLGIIAKLISGGLQTPIYVVNHPNSFDTHNNQVDPNDSTHTTGSHNNSLSLLSKAIDLFQQDLMLLGLQDRVTGMTFTEFGRRVAQNGTSGTDHGTATPMFFFGAKVNPAVSGGTASFTTGTAPINNNTQLNRQFDFRQVYYTVLKDWFQLSDADLQQVLFQQFTPMSIFNQTALPVTLVSFTGDWKYAKVSLQWVTDKETNIDYYEIQRSTDGVSYNSIGKTSALNITSRHTYDFYDTNLLQGFYYYRIKVVEKTGQSKYSNVLLLKDAQQIMGVRVKILPNPIENWFITSFQDKVTGMITVRMLDLGGKEIWKGEQQANDSYNLTFSINKSIAAGVYVMQVRGKDYEASQKVLVK